MLLGLLQFWGVFFCDLWQKLGYFIIGGGFNRKRLWLILFWQSWDFIIGGGFNRKRLWLILFWQSIGLGFMYKLIFSFCHCFFNFLQRFP